MNIILLGGSGFIGKRVAAILRSRGHQVCTPSYSELDFMQLDEKKAKNILANQDVVINAVGVMSRHLQRLETIHHHAPRQLAVWAKEMGVKRWVNLSALGADAQHRVAFVGSKGRGDEALLTSGLDVRIARPSVVFGRGGASCEIFLKMAKSLVLALPYGGYFNWQPVHIDDVAEGLANLTEQEHSHSIVAMVGATRHTMADYLTLLRALVHHKKGLKIIPIPINMVQPFLPLTNVLSDGFLNRDSMILLQESSCTDVKDFKILLGREPLGAQQFFRLPEYLENLGCELYSIKKVAE